MLHGIYTSPSEGSDTGEISYVSELLVGPLVYNSCAILLFTLCLCLFPGQGVGLTGQSLYGFELVFYEPINTEVNEPIS